MERSTLLISSSKSVSQRTADPAVSLPFGAASPIRSVSSSTILLVLGWSFLRSSRTLRLFHLPHVLLLHSLQVQTSHRLSRVHLANMFRFRMQLGSLRLLLLLHLAAQRFDLQLEPLRLDLPDAVLRLSLLSVGLLELLIADLAFVLMYHAVERHAQLARKLTLQRGEQLGRDGVAPRDRR